MREMPGLVRLGGWLGFGGLVFAVLLPGVPGSVDAGAGCPFPKPALTWRRMPSLSLAPGP